jgi:hypothetical protein
MNASRRPRVEGARCNKSTLGEQGPRPSERTGGARPDVDPYLPATGQIPAPSQFGFPRCGSLENDLHGHPRRVPPARGETVPRHRAIITWWSARATI